MARASRKKAKPSPSQFGGFAEIEKILEFMKRHGLSELEWEKKGERLRFRLPLNSHSASSEDEPRAAVQPSVRSSGQPAASNQTIPEHKAEAPAKALGADQKGINSPFVGTFYRAPAPDKEPYVREGQMVKRGDILCIIEAMKLMNEIESEHSGKVVSVLVENGQPVEYGEPLFILETR